MAAWKKASLRYVFAAYANNKSARTHAGSVLSLRRKAAEAGSHNDRRYARRMPEPFTEMPCAFRAARRGSGSSARPEGGSKFAGRGLRAVFCIFLAFPAGIFLPRTAEKPAAGAPVAILIRAQRRCCRLFSRRIRGSILRKQSARPCGRALEKWVICCKVSPGMRRRPRRSVQGRSPSAPA